MADPALSELARFEAGDIDPASFPHREHVRLAFEMLRRHAFTDAAARFAVGLRRMTARAGRPEAYHETTTVAFLAVIAERMGLEGCSDYAAFEDANRDLLDKRLLSRWYETEVLNSPVARRTFVLPRPRDLAR
jgi:hypothetical protein